MRDFPRVADSQFSYRANYKCLQLFSDWIRERKSCWTFSNVSHSHLLCQQNPMRLLSSAVPSSEAERKTGNINNSNNENEGKLSERIFFICLRRKLSRKRDGKSSRKVIKCWKILSLSKQWKWEKRLSRSWQNIFASSQMRLLFLFPSSISKSENISKLFPKRYSNVFGLAWRSRKGFNKRNINLTSTEGSNKFAPSENWKPKSELDIIIILLMHLASLLFSSLGLN